METMSACRRQQMVRNHQIDLAEISPLTFSGDGSLNPHHHRRHNLLGCHRWRSGQICPSQSSLEVGLCLNQLNWPKLLHHAITAYSLQKSRTLKSTDRGRPRQMSAFQTEDNPWFVSLHVLWDLLNLIRFSKEQPAFSLRSQRCQMRLCAPLRPCLRWWLPIMSAMLALTLAWFQIFKE